ncbi:MAG: flagellar biosynthesis protein FlhA [Candidatus Omnitrophota bacterium]|nr:MAG: flagellar biosynthesis protein FlhA [Candidatus Omnitrophota bacterium]
MADFDKADALAGLVKRGDVVLAGSIIAILIIMIVPLPFIILDFLMALNLALSLVIILLVVYLVKPLEFSSFPTLLLIVTLFRLSINVASTRLILLNGNSFDGKIIKAFGNFVVGGNYVVGAVIFLILVIIQFIVITKGAQRVAEVAARFTLDAMPGKQMAIDADLNAGIIDEHEAIERRHEISQEADFYGSMDGASKFVRGDAIAGIIITVVNILGGLIIGVTYMHMNIAESARVFMLLTIGDGLVSQFPALLISTASGILVTRTTSTRDGHGLGKQLMVELLSQPKGIAAVAVFLVVFALIPGIPKIPFFLMAFFVGSLARTLTRSFKQAEETHKQRKTGEKALEKTPESVNDLLQVDTLELEIGYGLIELVNREQGGDLLDRITAVRRQCAVDLGIIVPPIRIKDNMRLEANNYEIKLRGIKIAGSSSMPGYYLAMNPDPQQEMIAGIKTTEPAFGLPAVWISENQKAKAESRGFTVVNAVSVIATHLIEVIKTHSYEILGRQEVKNLLDNLKKTYPALVEEVVPNVLTVGNVQKVLQNLLREKIPIKDMITILEVLGDYAPRTKDTDILTEYVRHALSRHICRQNQDEEGKIKAVTLDPNLEEVLSSSVKKAGDVSYLALEPKVVQNILDKTLEEINRNTQAGERPVILCSPQIRMHFKRLTERLLPDVSVLSFNEIEPDIILESVGMVEVS